MPNVLTRRNFSLSTLGLGLAAVNGCAKRPPLGDAQRAFEEQFPRDAKHVDPEAFAFAVWMLARDGARHHHAPFRMPAGGLHQVSPDQARKLLERVYVVLDAVAGRAELTRPEAEEFLRQQHGDILESAFLLENSYRWRYSLSWPVVAPLTNVERLRALVAGRDVSECSGPPSVPRSEAHAERALSAARTLQLEYESTGYARPSGRKDFSDALAEVVDAARRPATSTRSLSVRPPPRGKRPGTA